MSMSYAISCGGRVDQETIVSGQITQGIPKGAPLASVVLQSSSETKCSENVLQYPFLPLKSGKFSADALSRYLAA